MTECGLCIYIYIFKHGWHRLAPQVQTSLVYIVGALQLMQGITLTKHKGFLLVEPLCHQYIYICICVSVHVYVRVVRYI